MKERRSPEITQEIVTKLEKLMMCSVSERYAFLYQLGLPHGQIRFMSMTGAPATCAQSIVKTINLDWADENIPSKAIDAILMAKLPQGIPA